MEKQNSQDRLLEKCAIFGVYTANGRSLQLAHAGLLALQHRGQESSGIVSTESRRIYIRKALGLATSIYHEGDLDNLVGHIAIGHNRYSTLGGSEGHIQPVISDRKLFALGHNGTIPVMINLLTFLRNKDIQNLCTLQLRIRLLGVQP